MAQKVKPTSFRLGITLPWSSRWFFKRTHRFLLEEDHLIREIIKDRILNAGIHSIEIERTGDTVKISIKAGRPGLIIGRGGKGIEDLKNVLAKAVKQLRLKNKKPIHLAISLNVEELRRGDVSAPIVAQQIAFDLEKRMSYRRVIKRQIDALSQSREVKGVKIRVSGRLDGAEISRSDWLSRGRMPLQTLRANIDYGEATAFNSYGTVGIKEWLYKGEIFN